MMQELRPYTAGMRVILRLSAEEAARLGHRSVGPEHLLLGLLRKGASLATQVLENLGINNDQLRQDIELRLDEAAGPTAGPLARNDDAKRVLRAARSLSESMKHGWIGTEHLLLALIQEQGTLPSRVLRRCGVVMERAQQELRDVLGHEMEDESEPGDQPADSDEIPPTDETDPDPSDAPDAA